MLFGVALQSDKQPDHYVALARAIDASGFDVVSVYNDLLYQPALGPLLWMAPHLHRARLGPAALNPYTLHPLEIAGQTALLDMASQGRAYLGLARGAWLETLDLAVSRPLPTLREAVLLVRHLLARRPEAFTGRVFRLRAGATLRYAPRREQVPIMLGTWGVKTARLAGEVADEVKIGGSANPLLVPVIRAAIAAGARKAGRDPASIGMCLGAVTVIDADARAARERARQEVAMYLPVVAHLDATLDDAAWLERLRLHAERDDYAAIASLIPDHVLDRFAFAGDPSMITRQVESLAAAGATRVEFGTPHGLADPTQAIRLLGQRVIPHFA